MLSKTLVIKGVILVSVILVLAVFNFSEKPLTSNIASVYDENLGVKTTGDSDDTSGDNKVSPSLSPTMSPKPIVSPSPSLSSFPLSTPAPASTPEPTFFPTPLPAPTPMPTPTPLPSPTPTLTPSPSPTPEPENNTTFAGVVINEIAWMGTSASTNDEWIELYNTTDQIVDLSGWTLVSKDGTPSITLSGTVGPSGFYLLERTSDQTISDISADKIYTGALGNGGEGLELRDNSRNLKDSADFSSGWPAGNNTTKSSMERIDPGQSGSNAANWATNGGTAKNGQDAGGNPINGTPKANNG